MRLLRCEKGKKGIRAISIMIGILLVCSFCTRKPPLGPQSVKQQSVIKIKEIELADNVRVLAPDFVSQNMLSIEKDKLIFRDNSSLQGLKKGEILLSYYGEGFLRKIRNIEYVGGKIIVYTEPASLTEAFKKLNILITDWKMSPGGDRGITTQDLIDIGAYFRYPLEYTFLNTDFVDPKTGLRGRAILKGYGSVSFEIVIDTLRIDIDWFTLKELKFLMHFSPTETVGVYGLGNISYASGDRRLHSPVLLARGMIGPVLVSIYLNDYIGAEATATGSITDCYVSREDVFYMGVEYKNGRWRKIADHTEGEWGYNVSASFTSELKGYTIVPEIMVKFYEVVGIGGRLKEQIRLSVNTNERPWWRLFFGIFGDIGVRVGLFEHPDSLSNEIIIEENEEMTFDNIEWDQWFTLFSKEWEIANSGGSSPENGGYEVSKPPFSWENTSTPLGLTGDDESILFSLPFSFKFFDKEYTSLYLCTNGYLSFTDNTSFFTPQYLPDSTEPNAVIAPFWRDLVVDSLSSITYYAGSDKVVISWENVRNFSDDSRQTFQVVLYRDGRIRFNYYTIDVDRFTGVGIEDEKGINGYCYAYGSGPDEVPLSSYFSIEFTPASNVVP